MELIYILTEFKFVSNTYYDRELQRQRCKIFQSHTYLNTLVCVFKQKYFPSQKNYLVNYKASVVFVNAVTVM
jgi:hypothetical protein